MFVHCKVVIMQSCGSELASVWLLIAFRVALKISFMQPETLNFSTAGFFYCILNLLILQIYFRQWNKGGEGWGSDQLPQCLELWSLADSRRVDLSWWGSQVLQKEQALEDSQEGVARCTISCSFQTNSYSTWRRGGHSYSHSRGSQGVDGHPPLFHQTPGKDGSWSMCWLSGAESWEHLNWHQVLWPAVQSLWQNVYNLHEDEEAFQEETHW